MRGFALAVWALLMLAGALYFYLTGDGQQRAGTPVERQSVGAFPQGAFTLSVSWQPAFCETRPDRPECQSQTEQRYDADHFALHGLWPEPASAVYCDTDDDVRSLDEDGSWSRLAPVELSAETRSRLDIVMPGTESLLHRHEWVKHGTCSGVDADDYYRASLALMEVLNASSVRVLFADAIGTEIGLMDVRSAFDGAFGAGAGDRVALDCTDDNQGQLIVGLKISLSGTIDRTPDMEALMRSAQPQTNSCGGGLVDRAGEQ